MPRLKKHEKKRFDDEKFFVVGNHPSPDTPKYSEIDELFMSLGLEPEKVGFWDRIRSDRGPERQTEANKDSLLEEINGESGKTKENYSGTESGSERSGQTFQKNGERSDIFSQSEKFYSENEKRNGGHETTSFSSTSSNGRDSRNEQHRYDGNADESGRHNGNGHNYRVEISDEVWETLVELFFKTIFSIIDSKIDGDFLLTESEIADLKRVTTPLLNKWTGFEFQYAQEVTFMVTICLIFSKKVYLAQENTIDVEGKEMKKDGKEKMSDEKKKSGQEMMDNLGDKKTQDTFVSGLFQMFSEKQKEVLNGPMRDITDAEFEQCKLFCKQFNHEKNIPSRKDAQGIINMLDAMEMNLNDMMGAIEAAGGPEILTEIISRHSPIQ